MSQWIGAQGRVNVAKKRKNTPLVTSPPENPKSKADKKFLSIWTRRLAESVGFEQLSSSNGWYFVGLQTFAKNVAHTGLKGPFDACAGHCSGQHFLANARQLL